MVEENREDTVADTTVDVPNGQSDSEGRKSGRVKELVIQDFKSYKGKEVVGPFKDFTTIIGPNGSGKSNLMDAISFVLGVRTGVLRGNSLRELIYVNTDSDDRPDRAEVTLVFQTDDGKKDVLFSRAILPVNGGESYASQYRLDGKPVTAEAYNAKLESFGILVKARNFLVFQGDIENIAQMSPKDLANLFETISGSAAYKREYQEAEGKLKDAESTMAIVFSKRKAIMAEKRQKKEQKTEAEKHIALMEQLEEMKVRKILWQLYHLRQDEKKAQEELDKLNKDLSAAEVEAAELSEEVDQKKRKHASVAKEALLIDKKIKKKRAEMEKKSPELIKIKEQIAHLQRRIKSVSKEKELALSKVQEQSERVENLKNQVAQLQHAQQQVELEIEESKKSQKSLSPDLLKEYNRIKQEYGSRASALEAEIASLNASAQADEESLRILEDFNISIDKRIMQVKENLDADKENMERAQSSLEKMEADRREALKQVDELRGQRRTLEAKKSQLERKLEETDGTLKEAKAETKQSQREETMRRLVSELKRTHPASVYGIVTDLADPTSDKYKLAMSVVMGRDIDSVIVDTPETAMKCIQVVKERRLPPMTFLPANTIRVREINPALRALGGTSKLAIDCLKFKDDRSVRAFKSICGDSLLCDTVEEARQLAYEGSTRHKVIALDGTAFLKNGLITGGMTAAMEDRAKKWDQEKVGKLKEARANVAKELLSLPQLRDITQQLQATEARSVRLENECNYAIAELKSLTDKIKESESNIRVLSKEKAAKEPQANALKSQLQQHRSKMNEIGAKMEMIADRCFKDFVHKIGVGSIKEYEEKHLKEVERLTERRAAIMSQCSRVQNQLEYEMSMKEKDEIQKTEQNLIMLRKASTELEKEASDFNLYNTKAKEELLEMGKQCDELKRQLGSIDADLQEWKEKCRKATDILASKKRTIASLESKIEQIKMSLSDSLEAAELENVSLPTKEGKSNRSKRKRSDKQDKPSDGAFSIPQVEDLDFGSLTGDDLLRDAASRRSRENEMASAIDEVSSQLSDMAPNLKAMEQFEEIKAREKEQLEEVEVSKKELKRMEDEYNRLRQRRFDLFNAALGHISGCIDSIYKELTRSSLHPSGGQAYLSPENAEEPFNGGIKFSAMPPTKRFRDMEQLSGGEKTVAALALLFAVHSFHPSPFFVLDEIDAALDSSNVARVALYLRSKTRSGSEGAFQGIVISLKDVFYEKADALVGVCREPKHGASSTLTFDLEKFDPPIGAAI